MRDDDSSENAEEFEQMLRSVLGDAAAEDILQSMKDSGFKPGAPIDQIFSGSNFTIVSQQIQQLLGSNGEGVVNWKIAEQVARETINHTHPDQLKTTTADAARSALQAASLWLDPATEFGPLTGIAMAWNRLDWIAHSLATLKRLLNPVGENIARAIEQSFTAQLGELPPEMAALMPQPKQFISQLISAVLGMQYGKALAELAYSSFGTSDTGIPLMEASTAALVPSNIADFTKDLNIEYSEVLAYVAVREVAAARLYTHVPWLRTKILDTVAEYARAIRIDTDAIESQLRDLNFDSPQAMQAIDLTDVFVLELSAAQEDALARLEHLISLVAGWVNEVAAQAVAPQLPNAVPLREMFTRRYATDNPAKHVWDEQLGMNLTPKMLRDSEKFWQLAQIKLGQEKRDALWNHPDLLPTEEALSNPDAFFEDGEPSDISAELDDFLSQLFATDVKDEQDIPHEPKFGTEFDSEE